MTWADYHRREDTLRAVVELADRRQDGRLPWDEVAEAPSVFGSPDSLLAALHMRWHTRLAGLIETALADEPLDLEAAVKAAWRRTAAELPGVRAILDANAERLATARRKEHMMLATMSGLAAMDDPHAVSTGERIEEDARAIKVQLPKQRRAGLLERLCHALDGAA
jgi:hypothetical protein